MSLSRNHDIFNSKFMILSIVIFTVFTVSLTENLQIADGLSAVSTKLVYKLDVGETQMLTWGIVNDISDPINLEFYATGEGSELLVFEQYAELAAHTQQDFEIFVIVPDDHPDNVEYRPTLYALQRGNIEEGKSGMIINIQMKTTPVIKIGENPVYTPPTVEQIAQVIEEKAVKQTEKPIVIKETMEEKLARIQAANEANQVITDDKTIIDEVSEENKEVTTEPSKIIPDDGYEPEPISDEIEEGEGGGCLIATAAYGSEMAPQVQLLREIRDNQLMNTDSGISFMTGFNQLYYSFSPTIADMQRENPMFQEIVKIGITPLLSSLSIMEYAESDSEVLGYGIGVILMNIGMYVGIPAYGIVKIFQIRRK